MKQRSETTGTKEGRSADRLESVSLQYVPWWYVQLTTFLAGGLVMVIEITASRILSPVFGNTVFLWTNIIGVILAAMTVGYAYGGRLADDARPEVPLCRVLMVSGVFVGFVPFLFSAALEHVKAVSMAMLAPVITTFIFFGIPAALLAAVSPLATKLATLADLEVGQAAGRVSALTAAGSIVGVFLTGFTLIPLIGSQAILTGVAIVLILLSTVGFVWVASTKLAKLTPGIVALLAVGVTSNPSSSRDTAVLFQQESSYHRVTVFEEERSGRPVRVLQLDTTTQGAIYADGRPGMPVRYTQFIDLVEAFVPDAQTALFIGGGAYAMPRRFIDRHRGARVEVFEVDPVVVSVANEFFIRGYEDKLESSVGDARLLLQNTSKRFDVVFGDAYDGIHWIPFHLTTMEYYELVRSRLSDRGIYMTNIISSVAGKNAVFFQATLRTLEAVFDQVFVFATSGPPSVTQNLILVCAVEGTYGDALRHPPSEVRDLMRAFVPADEYENSIAETDLLRDDHSPVAAMVQGLILGD